MHVPHSGNRASVALVGRIFPLPCQQLPHPPSAAPRIDLHHHELHTRQTGRLGQIHGMRKGRTHRGPAFVVS
jgi:hypothetical protein